MTISRTGWSTILVDSCKPLGVLYANNFSSGGATAAYANNNLVLSVPEGGFIGFAMEVAAGVDNTFEFNVGNISGASEQGVLVTVLETIDNVQYVIGGGRLLPGRQKVNFRSVANSVSLVFPEHFTEIELAMICTKYPKSVQHTYLVDVCDESKDRYRFGFNGQEKVNEIAGVGNHNTAQFWEYDTRLGRRWNLDPVDQVDISNYAVNLLNPISFNDPNGDFVPLVVGVYYGATILYAAWATYQVNKYYQENSSKPYVPPIRSRSENSPPPEAAKPAKNGATKVEKSDFQRLQEKWGDAQSRVSKTPQKARQASSTSSHVKSKATPIQPKAAPASVHKPEIRLAEQNDEPQPQDARLSPEEASNNNESEGPAGNRNILRPDSESEYEHTVTKPNAHNPDRYATYKPNKRSPSGFQKVKEVDANADSRPHANIPAPHTTPYSESGKKQPTRPAEPNELPNIQQ